MTANSTSQTTSKMILVVVESPYAPRGRYVEPERVTADHTDDSPDAPCTLCLWRKELDENIRYARMLMRDCLYHGESPLASHLLYTQDGVLDDTDPEQRRLGLKAGYAWMEHAQEMIVGEDLGLSEGMKRAIEWWRNNRNDKDIVWRKLPHWDGWTVEKGIEQARAER